jgi:HSP20 family protein
MADREMQISSKTEVAPEKGELTHEGTYYTPAVDIYETEKELVLLVDMPGVESEDVDIDLKENTLSIMGRVSGQEMEGHKLLNEYNVGSFFRNFCITDTVNRGGIVAGMSDGVLKLVIPKTEKAVPRKIPITTE